jgi:hypothetical protein
MAALVNKTVNFLEQGGRGERFFYSSEVIIVVAFL